MVADTICDMVILFLYTQCTQCKCKFFTVWAEIQWWDALILLHKWNIWIYIQKQINFTEIVYIYSFVKLICFWIWFHTLHITHMFHWLKMYVKIYVSCGSISYMYHFRIFFQEISTQCKCFTSWAEVKWWDAPVAVHQPSAPSLLSPSMKGAC